MAASFSSPSHGVAFNGAAWFTRISVLVPHYGQTHSFSRTPLLEGRTYRSPYFLASASHSVPRKLRRLRAFVVHELAINYLRNLRSQALLLYARDFQYTSDLATSAK